MVANGQQSKPTEIVVKSEPGIVTGALKTDPTKAFTVIKMNKHYMINLSYSGGESYLSAQVCITSNRNRDVDNYNECIFLLVIERLNSDNKGA